MEQASKVLASTPSQRSMLTEQVRPVDVWTVKMSNRQVFEVSSELKKMILGSPTQLIELPNGEIVNKAHIVCISISEYSPIHDPLLQVAKENNVPIKQVES